MLKDSLKCSLSNKRKVPLTRGLKSLEETWFQVKNNLSVAKLRLFLTIKGVKPSNTHQKARVSPSTSVQLWVNYQMVEVTRKKCKSEFWACARLGAECRRRAKLRLLIIQSCPVLLWKYISNQLTLEQIHVRGMHSLTSYSLVSI